mmetsp:Transcript_65910/g.153150  ORF Transcript_65910/g.153150 Transcript_65910/m.153150 type:complete len:275 (-) Transcript_65910:76-900(-)
MKAMTVSALMSPVCTNFLLSPAFFCTAMAGNSWMLSMLSMASLNFSVSVYVTKYLPRTFFATLAISGLFAATTASKPSSPLGKRLQTRPLPASIYLSNVSPSSLPNSGRALSRRKAVTFSLSSAPEGMSMGSSPPCVSVTFGAPEALTKCQEAFRRLLFAASSKLTRRFSAFNTSAGLSPSPLIASAEAVDTTAGPVMDTTHSTMVSAVRPPSYSVSLESSNHQSVGKPLTLYFAARSFSSVASTLPNFTLSFSCTAAFSNSGASFLQWPHHGA